MIQSLKNLVVAGLLLAPYLSHAADIGLLWRIQSPDGKTSHLFGSMHADDGRITDFPPILLQAIRDADIFYAEVMPQGDTATFYMNDGRKLSDLLTAEEYDRVCELADAYVMHREQANRMKPWLLAIALDPPKPSSIFSQDVLLAGLARDNLKPIKALELRDQHFTLLDNLSMEEQLVILRSVLNRTQEEKERDFEALLSAYLSGNLDQVAGLDQKMTEGLLPTMIWEKMRHKLLDERNIHMAAILSQELRQSNIFVVVGASHLAGRGGLLQRLREAGFHVNAVYP